MPSKDLTPLISAENMPAISSKDESPGSLVAEWNPIGATTDLDILYNLSVNLLIRFLPVCQLPCLSGQCKVNNFRKLIAIDSNKL